LVQMITIIALVQSYSAIFNMNPAVVASVIQNESAFNEKAIGKRGEIGLMQLLPSSFPKYTRTQLFDPSLNIWLGVKYLAESRRTCVHQHNHTWLVCYNLGPTKAKKIVHPKQFPYYKKVMGLVKKAGKIPQKRGIYASYQLSCSL